MSEEVQRMRREEEKFHLSKEVQRRRRDEERLREE